MSIYWRIKTYPNNIEIVLKLVINATLWTGKKKLIWINQIVVITY